MTQLDRTKVFITGAAKGIGREISLILARKGCELFIVDRDTESLNAALQELRELGAKAHGWPCDITSVDDLNRVRDAVATQSPEGIDVLVNNAGIAHGGPFLKVSLSQHQRTYEVNILGLVKCTHVFLPLLLKRRRAHLVNIASATGLVGVPYGTTYASSKWAVIGFSESLRQELKELGQTHVKVTTICPSTVSTGLFEGTKPPLLMPMLHAPDLARKIVKAVERDKAYLLEPFFIKLVPFMNGTLPRFIIDWLLKVLKVTSAMQGWKGRG